MPRSLPLCVLALFALGLPLAAEVGEFGIRPVIPLSPERLTALRELLSEDPEAQALAVEAVEAAEPFLDAEPQPLRVIHYEGLVNTDPKRIATVAKLREMDQVAALVRRWQVQGDAATAAALLRFVDAWSATYEPTGNDVNENKFVPLLVAWHALRGQADASLQEQVAGWVDRLAPPHCRAVKKSKHLNNRYTKHVRLVALFGLINDRDDWLALARKGVERFVAESLRPDGTSLDLELRDTLTYHCSSLKPPIELAIILGDEALYRWESADGASLKESVDYVVPYATGAKTRREWVNSRSRLDRERAEAGLEKYRKGRLFDPQDARGLLALASCFDPALRPLAQRLSGTEGRYIGWRSLIHAAVQAAAAD